METDAPATDETVFEVGEFYQLLTARLESAFGRRHPHWVRGEIAKVYEKGHIYIDLVDAGSASTDTKRPVLNTHCWGTPWAPIKKRLAADGITLKAGMIVSFFGYVDVYAPQGKIGFTISQVDVQGLMGEVAKRRAELVARLQGEGLLESNKRVVLPPVPLRVGLVASPGTEGYSDFTGQLLASGYGFEIVLASSAVQGEAAPAQIVNAIESLDEHGVDVICVVRGGGSKGDLACFDDERVARAIAGASTAVFTGIGHTGDESVADLVAHTRAITPTKLGEQIVAIVADWHQRRVVAPAQRILTATSDVLDEATEYVAERRRTMILAVRDRLRAEERHLASTRGRLIIHARHLLDTSSQKLASARQLLSAYDPERRLRQGWSIVTDERGGVVKSVDAVETGDVVRVMVADGTFTSTVNDKNGAGT